MAPTIMTWFPADKSFERGAAIPAGSAATANGSVAW